MSFSYKYPHPAVTVDAIVFAFSGEGKEVLLIQRKHPPFQGQWAFPGGFLDSNETLEQAIRRELQEETGLVLDSLKQFKTFSDLERDTRGRTISTVFVSVIDKKMAVKASDDALSAKWFPLSNLPILAFDHKEILREAVEWCNIEKNR